MVHFPPALDAHLAGKVAEALRTRAEAFLHAARFQKIDVSPPSSHKPAGPLGIMSSCCLPA